MFINVEFVIEFLAVDDTLVPRVPRVLSTRDDEA